MNMKRNFGLLLFWICFLAVISPALSQEKFDDGTWETGHITAIGKDYIKVDKVKYRVSPDVAITGELGDDRAPDLKNLRDVDEIMFRVVNDIIIEIRILRLTS